MQWMKLPSKTYFERDSIEYLQKCRDVERVMIVTDHAMVELGFLDRIIEQLDLRRNKVVYQIFADVEPDPDITTVERGTEIMRSFKPDTIIALGGSEVESGQITVKNNQTRQEVTTSIEEVKNDFQTILNQL